MLHIAILGRQPEISLAELEALFGSDNVLKLSNNAASVECENIDIQKLGGSLKAGIVIEKINSADWRNISQKIVKHYVTKWNSSDSKITLGISVYDFPIASREVQKTGIIIKRKLKSVGISLRLIPNSETALTTAVSHHNKLGLSANKVELLVVRSVDGSTYIAESTGAQNITAYSNRDQNRPKRDAFVGMLPPKLAQIMINLATDRSHFQTPISQAPIVLDPFCGTGVVLQEAALLGFSVYGSDLSDKMIRYTRDNLNWLADSHNLKVNWYLHEGDAMTTKWRNPIDAVVCETYLGQPFSVPPSQAKLDEVRQNCNHIISDFLDNIGNQIKPGTPLCIAVPAWRDVNGRLTHLPLINSIEKLGYKRRSFNNLETLDLIYCRPDQIVGRELLVLTKT